LAGILHKQENDPNQKGDGDKGFEHSWLFAYNWLLYLNVWLDSPLFVSQFGGLGYFFGDSADSLLDLVVGSFQELHARI
jgi:hypothetical protein